MKAQCHCGNVQYTLGEEVASFVNCHCTMCRRINGSAFTSWVSFPISNCSLDCGEDSLEKYVVTKNVTSHFCKNCGTRMLLLDKRYPTFFNFNAGVIDNLKRHKPTLDLFFSHKADWYAEEDEKREKRGGESGMEQL